MSLEERYDEVRQLIEMGKEKGYLLNDEVSELLPADITTSDELFTAFGNAGIEVVDSEQKYREHRLLDRHSEGSDDIELDLTPSAIDKTNDPVRMYLREMRTVPLAHARGRDPDRQADRAREAVDHQGDLADADHRQGSRPDGRAADER